MRLTYSRSTDMAYLEFASAPPGTAVRTEALLGPDKAMINLDFDDAGRLLGIEFSSASVQLPKDLLGTAEVDD